MSTFTIDGIEYDKTPGTPEQLVARRALITALRSGKYAQGTQRLRTNDSYCCLGVACDISGLGQWKPDEDFPSHVNYFIGEHKATGSLSYNDAGFDTDSLLTEFFGLSDIGAFPGLGVEYGGDTYHHLAELNDSVHWTFLQIADLIEERFEVADA